MIVAANRFLLAMQECYLIVFGPLPPKKNIAIEKHGEHENGVNDLENLCMSRQLEQTSFT